MWFALLAKALPVALKVFQMAQSAASKGGSTKAPATEAKNETAYSNALKEFEGADNFKADTYTRNTITAGS